MHFLLVGRVQLGVTIIFWKANWEKKVEGHPASHVIKTKIDD